MPVSPRFLLRNTPEDVLAYPLSDIALCHKLVASLPVATNPPYIIWLTHIEQVHRFVRRIPDLAWELMDYATEPLAIIYSETKPIFLGEKAPDEVCIRLISQPPLLKVLSTRHAWLTIRADRIPKESSLAEWVDKEVDLKGKIKKARTTKLMRVFDNGGFSFLS